MSSANLTRAETANRARHVRVHDYRVDIDVRDAANPTVPRFPVTSSITLTSRSRETWLDFIGEVDELLVDGVRRRVEYDGARIRLTGLPRRRCTVTVAAHGRYSRTGEGLHRFVDPADGETYLYTHCEPAGARRVFPNLEQPDIRAPFTFSMTGPVGWWMGSNQPESSRTTVAEGVVRVEFAPTHTLSTYITCLAAGPYHRVVDTWHGMELGLICRQSLARYLDSEELLRLTRAGMDWLTANLGDYPWGRKYDQIFVPEHNLGVMENPGLVTVTEQYLFRSPATPAQLQGRATTLVHEMSHMWFGDLVTPRWWGDLWLKESVAEFMGTHVSVEACGFADGWVNFATSRKTGGYLADSRPTTHAIVADIRDLESAKTNFDRITYSKGASALTQLMHHVGIEAFLAGCRRYFRAHAFASATLSDFVAALDAETDRDVSSWVEAWLESAGHDRLSAHWDVHGGYLTGLRVRRDFYGAGDPTAERRHATTVGLYRLQGDRLRLEQAFDVRIDSAEVRIPEADGLPAPDAVLINHTDQTFARLELDAQSRDVLVSHVADLEPLTRAVVWTALWGDVREGLLAPADFVTSVLRARESHSGVLEWLQGRAFAAVDRYVAGDVAAGLWRDGCRAEALAALPGSAEQLSWVRAYLRAAGLAAQDVRWVLDGGVPGLEVSVDVSWLAWQSLAAQGSASDAELAAALASDDTATGRTAHLRARMSRPDPGVKEEAWRRAHTVGGESNDAVAALMAGFGAPGQDGLRARFAGRYFEHLTEVWRDHPIEIAMPLVEGGFPVDAVEPGHRWLREHPDAPEALRRLVREEVYEAEVAAHVRSATHRAGPAPRAGR